MSKVRKDEVRENRIMMEIVVDAYGSEEQAMGWYYYLDDTLSFPFLAKCITKRAISPLRVGDEAVWLQKKNVNRRCSNPAVSYKVRRN